VSLSCAQGFQLAGGFPLRECTSDGFWSGSSNGGSGGGGSGNLHGGASAKFVKGSSPLGKAKKFESALSPKGIALVKPQCLRNLHSKGAAYSDDASDTLIEWVKFEQQRAAVGTKSMPSSSRDHPLGSLSPTSTMLGGASSARFYAASPNVGHAKHSRKDMTEFLESCGLAYLQTALSVAMPGSVQNASAFAVNQREAPSLSQLLVLITRHGALSAANIWPRDRRRLLACAQDYLFTGWKSR
jgi:hypothetical protein